MNSEDIIIARPNLLTVHQIHPTSLATEVAPEQRSHALQNGAEELTSATQLNREPSFITPERQSSVSSATNSSFDEEEESISKNWITGFIEWKIKRIGTAVIRFANLIVGEHPHNLNFFASSNSAEKMDEVPDEEVKLFSRIVQAVQKIFISVMLFEYIFYHSTLSRHILTVFNPEDTPPFGEEPPTPQILREMTTVLAIYWATQVLMTCLFVVCIRHDKPWLIEPILIIMYLQNFLAYLNFEHRHLYQDRFGLRMFQNGVNMLGIFMVLQLYFSLPNSQHYPFLFISGFSISLGCIVYESESRVSIKVITDNLGSYLTFTFSSIVGNFLVRAIFLFVKQQFLNYLIVKVGLHNEIMSIIENLEVALITRNESGLGFCNLLGFKMLKTIWNDLGPKESELDLSQRQNILYMSGWMRKGPMSDDERKTESTVLNAKVFRVYKPPQEGEARDRRLRDEKAYSFEDIFSMSPDELKNLVFWVLKKYHDNSHLGQDLYTSPRGRYRFSDQGEIIYLQVKKQTFTGKNGIIVHDVLQIVDISDHVMCNKATAEKKLLTLINAAVSHEMRNPLNSIHCQNLLQHKLSRQLSSAIENREQYSQAKQLKKLARIEKDLSDSVCVQESSTNLLRFIVNDILDFAQISSGKFRQNLAVFKVDEALSEVIHILKQKADHRGVRIALEIGRDIAEVFQRQQSRQELSVCADERRLQQVVLNLLSNSIKFSSAGKVVRVMVKRLQGQEDMVFGDFTGNKQASLEDIEEIVCKARYGCLQVTVEDEGIGISGEDQAKLFELFGFVDEREGLNPKGIGLGLHICRKIVREFGGEIVCTSERCAGARFTLVLPLSPAPLKEKAKVERCLNPVQRNYPKFRLRQFSGSSLSRRSLIGTSQRLALKAKSRAESEFSDLPIETKEVALHKIERKIQIDRAVVELTLNEKVENISSLSSTRKARHGSVKIEASKANEAGSIQHFKTAPRKMSSSSIEEVLTTQIDKRILIVDDEPYNIIGNTIMLKQAAKQLKGKTFAAALKDRIDKASNGKEAVEAVKRALQDGSFSYALILMDCSMPIMDGYEATEEIRALYKLQNQEQPRIIACTGHVEPEYVTKAFSSGMDEVIGKPVEMEVLKEVVNEVFRQPDG